MTKRKCSMLGTILVAAGLSLPAHAAILDLGTLTRDTATNLDWLDLTATQGVAYGTVDVQLQSGGSLQGYQRGTIQQTNNFLTHLGLPTNGTIPGLDGPEALQYLTLLQTIGVTQTIIGSSGSGIFRSRGYTLSPEAFANPSKLLAVEAGLTGPSGTLLGSVGVSASNAFANPNVPSALHGHFLVIASGATSTNPILPDATACPVGFCFGSTPVAPNVRRFFDPIVSTGYTFESHNALKFQKIFIPNAYGDGTFDLFLFDGSGYLDSGVDLTAGVEFDFATLGFPDGVSRFSIRGIETSASVDPTNPIGFVTGLTFSDDGTTNFSMTPITFDTDAPTIDTPEPATLALLGVGLSAFSLIRRRRKDARR